jgi:hypothetical protein
MTHTRVQSQPLKNSDKTPRKPKKTNLHLHFKRPRANHCQRSQAIKKHENARRQNDEYAYGSSRKTCSFTSLGAPIGVAGSTVRRTEIRRMTKSASHNYEDSSKSRIAPNGSKDLTDSYTPIQEDDDNQDFRCRHVPNKLPHNKLPKHTRINNH